MEIKHKYHHTGTNWNLPKYISGLLEAVSYEALQLNWRSSHHMLFLLPLHWHGWHWNIWQMKFLLSNLLDATYYVKLENLADFRVGWNLAVEVARVGRICEFQLQRILTASEAETVSGKTFPILQLVQSRQSTSTCAFSMATITLTSISQLSQEEFRLI